MAQASEAKNTLLNFLTEVEFNFKNPDCKLGWDIFKKFSQIQIDCSEDAFLFECGVYNFTGESLFHFEFVRQFSFEDNGEYDHMEQLRFTFYFEPNDKLNMLETNLWTYDCDSLEDFFKQIENMNEFNIPTQQFKPIRAEIYQEEI